MKIHPILLAFACYLPLSFAAENSWTPYVAKLRKTQTVAALDGRIISQQVVSGIEMRDRNGSLHFIPEGGQPGTFHDALTGHLYEINYATRSARQTRTLPVSRALRGIRQPSIEASTIEGIPCLVFAVFDGAAKGKQVPVGKMWASLDHDIVLKNEVEVEPQAGAKVGQKRTFLQERTEVRFENPPAERFGIPSGFSVTGDAIQASCQGCSKPNR